MRRFILSIALVGFSVSATAQTLTETAPPGTSGLWFVASPKYFTPANGSTGTYYYPTVIERNGYAFLFAQGGQFGSTSPFLPHCEGDKTLLWRAPLTNAGLRGSFTPLRRVSRCDSNATYRVHWTMTNAYYSSARGKVMIVSERQQLRKSDNFQISSSIWLLEGTFNGAQTDVPTWTYTKLFETDQVVDRIESFSLTVDTSRTPPNDGFTHELYRGFARIPANSTVEWRIDFSPKHCATAVSCTLIEFKQSGIWMAVVNDTLNFVPDILLSSFRPNNIVQRNGQAELWGSAIVVGNDCPCNEDKPAAQFRWYTIDAGTFALTGPHQVFSSIRCMPAEPQTNRMGAEIVLVNGTQYLFSGQNDDAGCSYPTPLSAKTS